MDELQTLIKPELLHNTCCHAKLEAHRDKGKWIKESGSQLLPSQRHDYGSGRIASGELGRAGEEPPGTLRLSHTPGRRWGREGCVGPRRSTTNTTAAAGPTRAAGNAAAVAGVFTMMNIRGTNVMVMSEGTVSQGLVVMGGVWPARLIKAMEARKTTRVAAPERPTSGTAPHEEP